MRERSERPSADQLQQLPRFSDTPHRHLASLASHTRWRVFEPGEVILEEGDPPDEVYALYSGEVEIFQNAGDVRQTQSVLGPGEVFGELGVLAGHARTAGALARTSADVWAIEGQAFLGLLSASQVTALKTLQSLAGYLLDTGAVGADLLFRDMRTRMAARLITVRERGPSDEIDIKDLARWIGGTNEAVKRQAEDLAQEGLIELTGDVIKVVDLESLRALTGTRVLRA